jgi:predicted amidophosphoribosyltransferase
MNGHVGAAVDALCERWIGWSFPPPARAIADARWRPDSARDYCERCGDSVGEGEATPDGCGTCREGAELSGGIGDGVVRLGPYVDPIRGWIRAIKFAGWDEMAETLGAALAEALRVRLNDDDAGRSSETDGDTPRGIIDRDRTLIVPMPMPWQRRLYRGSDHAAAIARAVSHSLNVPMFRVLSRSNHAPQVSLTPTDRKRSGGRGLRVSRRMGWNGLRKGASAWPLEGLDVVLVDDVRTTGATLKAAVRMVRSLKPRRVVCAVLAVSDSRARQQRRGGVR